MNLSKIALDSLSTFAEAPQVDTKPLLRQREQKLIKVIEALQEVQQSPAWSTLKNEVFDGLVATLEQEIKNEAKKENPESTRLNRIAGQLRWAEKYADLEKLERGFKVELQGIRKTLYDK